jgi:hypothetical protein
MWTPRFGGRRPPLQSATIAFPDLPSTISNLRFYGGIAQLVERQLCKLDVRGSNPLASSLHRAKADLLPGEHRRLACGCRRLAGIIYGLSSFRRAAETSTRAACAPQKEMRVTRSDLGRPSSFLNPRIVSRRPHPSPQIAFAHTHDALSELNACSRMLSELDVGCLP